MHLVFAVAAAVGSDRQRLDGVGNQKSSKSRWALAESPRIDGEFFHFGDNAELMAVRGPDATRLTC